MIVIIVITPIVRVSTECETLSPGDKMGSPCSYNR